MMLPLQDFLFSIEPISPSILEAYCGHWKHYSAPKKTVLTAPGETESFIYYIVEGIQKCYYQTEERQHIITFAYPPSFSGVLESFFNQSPSRYYLETVTESSFLRLSYQKHEELLTAYPELNVLFRRVTERFLDGVIQRQHELMALDMEERFRVFVKRSPHLLAMLPQKDLASYLRIDPTNFSKLINRIQI